MTPEPSELQELVRALHQQATPWLPAGLGTRLHWGPPLQGAQQEPPLVLSTARLNRLVEHCAGDFTVTVQAGVPLQQLQQELAREGQWLAIDWPWGSGPDGSGSGSVGGLVARGMAGGLRQRYLGVRDQLVGLSLLRADGTAAKAGGKVVKNVAGFDLMRLLCGSWGSLGLITDVTLRTFPRPRQRLGLLLLGAPEKLEQLRRQALAAALPAEQLDWWSADLAAQALAEAHAEPAEPALVISLSSVSPEALTAQRQELQQQAAALGLAVHNLDGEPLQQALALELGPDRGGPLLNAAPRWLLRWGVPPASAAELFQGPLLEGLTCTLAAGSGVGLAWGDVPSVPAFRVEALRQRCQALGGYLTVLEQPAANSASALPAWGDAPAKAMIQAVKRQFDPLQQLARGRLPGVQPASSV
jgi:glycolate oxidase FAD binding subunit